MKEKKENWLTKEPPGGMSKIPLGASNGRILGWKKMVSFFMTTHEKLYILEM